MAQREIQRYTDRQRMNHWIIALLFFAAALSGLSLFHPSLYFLSNLFGGGPWTRILHPFMGLLMVLFFLGLAAAVWHENRVTAGDREWRRHAGEMLRGHEENLPPVGKYNYGQKLVFWVLCASLAVLLVTGFMFWRPWFAYLFPITLVRIAVLLHAIAAVVLILAVIAHIYAAIWVKGTIRAMTRGTVTEAWARRNHALWHREMTQGK
jgi:formate dehydrogenase subunit gamma